jgi:multiple sugar transport system permease protein
MRVAETISGRRRRRAVWLTLMTILIAAYVLFPITWMALSSFQDERVLQSRPPRVLPTPDIFTLDHYNFVLTGRMPEVGIMLQAMYTMSGTYVLPSVVNSLVIAVTITLANLILGVPAAHAFARIRFTGNRALFMALFATRMLPALSIVVPMFVIVSRLGLLDTKLALMVIYTAITVPFTLWLLRAYFAHVPQELEEAARVDGASRWTVLWKIVLPVAKPGLIASAVVAFMLSYGEFPFALILTQSLKSRTMPALMAGIGYYGASRGMIAAASILSFVPPLVLAALFRRQLIDGLTQRFD